MINKYMSNKQTYIQEEAEKYRYEYPLGTLHGTTQDEFVNLIAEVITNTLKARDTEVRNQTIEEIIKEVVAYRYESQNANLDIATFISALNNKTS